MNQANRRTRTALLAAFGTAAASFAACSDDEKAGSGPDASAESGGAGPAAGGSGGGGRASGGSGQAGGRSGGGASSGGASAGSGGAGSGGAPGAGGAGAGGDPSAGGAQSAGGSGAGGGPAVTRCGPPVRNATVGNTCHGTPAPALQLTEIVGSGLTRPLVLVSAPGDAERLFVIEQAGLIRVIRNGSLEPTPFLDIVDLVDDGENEQGLLGLAFHPDYAQNGRFYVHYNAAGTVLGDHVVAEYRATPGQAADRNTARELSRDEHFSPLGNHNGGMLAFSPKDNCLYVAFGDGGSSNDPGNRAQDVTEPLGSLLRIDVDAPTTPAPGNMTTGGADPRTWDYGLRNPWRFSFDRATGDLYIGDVGQGAWEEIDVSPSGVGQQNYGWKIMEGMDCRPGGPASCDMTGLRLPAVQQPNDAEGGPNRAIIGGYVYRGARMPGLVGRYLYGDYASRNIWTFTYAGENGGQPRICDDELLTIRPDGNITSFGEDLAGEIYVLTERKVFRIDPG